MSDLAELIALQKDNIARAKAHDKRLRRASAVNTALVFIWLGAALGAALMVADRKFAAMDLANQEVAHVAR